MDKVQRLADVIDFVIRCHPMGLRIIAGDVPPPSTEDLMEILSGFEGLGGCDVARVDASPSGHGPQESLVLKADEMEKILAWAGGWKQIITVTKEYTKAFPKDWGIFIHHVLWIDSLRDHSRLHEPQLQRVARKFGVSEETVLRRRKEVPRAIARAALLAPVEDWVLLGGI